MLKQLWNDDYGVIISAELVLILTILVIGVVVGLSEIQHALNTELDDIGNAIGSINQSYSFSGASSTKLDGTLKAAFSGSAYSDSRDDCDGLSCDASEIGCDLPMGEKTAGVNDRAGL